MLRARKLLVTAGLAGGFLLGFASTAHALGSGPLYLDNGTGHFSGNWEFYPQGTGHGGLHVWGSVCDDREDGNGVYGQGRVHGYDWSSKRGDGNGAAAGCGSENREFYDPATTYSSYGYYQVCTDDLGPDTCKVSSRLNR